MNSEPNDRSNTAVTSHIVFVTSFVKRHSSSARSIKELNELFTVGLNIVWFYFQNHEQICLTEMENSRVSVADDVRQICRSCMCKGDNLIPLDLSYNHVVNTKYDYVGEGESIANLMMVCGNVKVN